jgi:hypothetical protein
MRNLGRLWLIARRDHQIDESQAERFGVSGVVSPNEIRTGEWPKCREPQLRSILASKANVELVDNVDCVTAKARPRWQCATTTERYPVMEGAGMGEASQTCATHLMIEQARKSFVQSRTMRWASRFVARKF